MVINNSCSEASTYVERYESVRECLEEQIRVYRSTAFYYKFLDDGRCEWYVTDKKDANKVTDPQEMIEIAIRHFNKYGFVDFEGTGGNGGGHHGGHERYSCRMVTEPKADEWAFYYLKDYDLVCDTLKKAVRNNKDKEEKKQLVKAFWNAKHFRSDYCSKYTWDDEVFHENGLLGLRNVKGEVLIPCNHYDFIYGFDYFDTSLLAIASKNGRYGLVKRDGKGTVITPFDYHYIKHMNCRFTSHKDEIDIGYKNEDWHTGNDLIINGQVVLQDVFCHSWLRGVVFYRKNGKVGVYQSRGGGKSVITPPIYDDWFKIYDDEDEYIDFALSKDGKEGIVTINNEFIPLDDYFHMTEEQKDEQFWDSIVGHCHVSTIPFDEIELL